MLYTYIKCLFEPHPEQKVIEDLKCDRIITNFYSGLVSPLAPTKTEEGAWEQGYPGLPHMYVYVAVPGRNLTLFYCVFQSRCLVQTVVV